MRVTVIIVNLNGDPFIYGCLAGLERQSFKDFEVIVVDNGSRDGSMEKIRLRFSSARIIELGENKGFAFACSRGWKESRGKEIAVLNNDAVPERDWLKAMVETLDSDPRLGMVACKVINQKTGKLESGGLYPARNGLVYLWRPQDEDKPSEVFGTCGVAGLYRGAMLQETGFYSADFFIYYEDADLAYRARRAGWTAAYCPKAVVRHLGSKTTAAMGIKNYCLPRNRLRSVIRNWDPGSIMKNLPWLMAYEGASFAAGIFSSPIAAVRARIDFLRFLSCDLEAHKEIFSKAAQDFNLSKWLSKDYPGIVELGRARK